jgi:iron complex outermembrane recepter protein
MQWLSRGACLLALGLPVAMPRASAQDASAESQWSQAVPDEDLDELWWSPQQTAPEPAMATAPEDNAEPVQLIAVDPIRPAEEPAPLSASRGSRLAIEEIIVTAQKREESVQSVPLTISAFSGDVLDAKGVVDQKDLQLITPGLQYGEMAGYSIIFIRGVGSDAFQATVDSSVATYIDGLYIPYTSHQAQALGSVERVEVLKGPQGTLFGRNTVGGAINVTTKKPGDSFEAAITADFGNFSRMFTKAYLSAPLTDSLGISLAGLYNVRDSYWERLVDDGAEYREYKDVGGKVTLSWRPSDWFELDGAYYTLTHESAGSLAGTLTRASLIGQAAGLPTNDEPFKTGANPDVGIDFDLDIYAVTGLLRTDWFDIKSISGWQDMLNFAHYDYDSTEVSLIDFFAFPQFAKVFTQELQILSNDSAPHWWRWIIGGYFEDSHKGFENVPVKVPVQSLLLGYLGGLGTQLQNVLTGLPGGLATDATAVVTLHGSVETSAYAVFGQTTFDMTPWASLTLGLRYSSEKRSIDDASSDVTLENVLGQNTPPTQLLSYEKRSQEYSDLSPKVTLDFKPTQDMLVYASYAEGFKAGNFNGINLTMPPQQVEPEKVQTYEVGLKSDLFDRRVRFNFSVFRNEVADGQIQFISLLSGGLVAFENASAYTIDGADVELTWAITQNLIFNAVGNYLDGRYDDFVGSGFNENTGVLERDIDFSGNDTVRSPRKTATLSLSYFMELGSFDFEIAGDTYYNSGFFYNPANTVEESAYRVHSARLSGLHRRSGVRLTLWGRNLTDEVYTMQKFEHDFGVTTIYAPQRTYGVTLQWNY